MRLSLPSLSLHSSRSIFIIALGLLTQGLATNFSIAQNLAEADTFSSAALTQQTIDGAVRTRALADRDAYLLNINELETRPGNYGPELAEAFLGLGSTLQTLEQHEEAAEAFGRALQALRIGYGLNDVRQVPVLEELRSTHERIGNWSEVHWANHLIFYIAKRSAGADADLRIRSALELGRWLRKASAENLVSDFEASPTDVTELYKNELARLEALDDYDGRSMHLANLYLDLAATELSEAKRKYELPISEFQAPGAGEQRTTIQQTCYQVLDRSGRAVQICTDPMEVPNLNYYLAPNAMKNSQIRAHLGEVEDRVMAAYYALQDAPAAAEQRTAMLAEVQRLTGEYNDFVAANRSNPQFRPD